MTSSQSYNHSVTRVLFGGPLVVASWLLITACSGPADVGPPPQPPAPAKTVHVLFLGNSFTYFHDMPEIFREHVDAVYPGVTAVVDSVTRSGATLEQLWNDGEALRRIEARSWDYVVMQQHAGMSARFVVDGDARTGRPDAFFEYGARFAEAIARRGARPVFYLPYAGDDAKLLAQLEYANTVLARNTRALLAPVGVVWKELHGSKALELYDSDGAHPSPAGAYLIAITIARTIFGAAPGDIAGGRKPEIPREAAAEVEAAVARVHDARVAAGPYPELPEPEWQTPPALDAGDEMTPRALAGTWSVVDSGLAFSLGSQLAIAFEAGAPKVAFLDHGVHAILSLPIENYAFEGRRFRFETQSNNRRYIMTAALEGERLHVLVEFLRGSRRDSQVAPVDARGKSAAAGPDRRAARRE